MATSVDSGDAKEGADLVVVDASLSDDSPAAGGNSSLSVTVRNVGANTAAATTVRYYRSDDATISSSDTKVGTAAVAALPASGSISQSFEVTAPVSFGAYYYGACVDPVRDETDTTNNCSTALRITVQDTAPAQPGDPDLVVASATVSDSSPSAGARFALSVSVTNGGGGSSAATTLHYYRSADATITTSDAEVGTAELTEISASGSTNESVELTAPGAPGIYYYGACVDSVTSETDATNNCSTSVRITIREPDLVVVSPTMSDYGPAAGVPFAFTATARNDGTGTAPATTLRYYRSSDDTITTSDTQVGTKPVGGLASSGSSSQSVDLSAPAAPGIYYYGACVDAVADESDTTNNCSTSVEVTVQQMRQEGPQGEPDLKVTSVTVSDSGPAAGARFRMSATVTNDGDGAAGATTLRYYRSSDGTITDADTEVGNNAIVALADSGSAGKSVELTASATPGTYYYGACVDAVTDESDTTNNCSASVPVTVPQPARPDLIITAILVSDSTPATGARFTLSATVSNGGDGEAAATPLRYYRSADATITTSDVRVGTEAIAGLAAAGSVGGSVELTAPATPGTYYYGACVDAVTNESDTANNCSGYVTVTILEPDLVAGSPTASTSEPEAGASFTLSVTVANDGEGESDATTLRYYQSTDTVIDASDTPVAVDSVTGLAATASSRKSVELTAPATPGTYYYGACVDAVTDESDTTNNCSATVTVTVPAPKPDLVVGSPTVDDSDPAPGAAIELSATVENDGEGSAEATTLRYYRSTDATITTSDTAVGTDSIAGLAATVSSSQSTDLTAPDTAGTYYYGACVDAVADESDTTNNCSTSAAVTVSQPTVPEEQEPDLVVGSSAASESDPAAGTDFTLSATAENTGQATAGAATLRFYRSPDATITTADTEVGTDTVTELAPSGFSSVSLDVAAPDTAGTYYYGACVDAVANESDTMNNCSPSVQVMVPTLESTDLPPTFVSARTDGDTVTVTFSENIFVHPLVGYVRELYDVPLALFLQAAFSVTIDGDEVSLTTSTYISGANLILDVAYNIHSEDQVEVSHNNSFARNAGALLVDANGHEAPLFGSQEVRNEAPSGRSDLVDGAVLTPAEITIPEGASGTYSVVLPEQPSANTTVRLFPYHIVTVSHDELTFTPENWNVSQTVTVHTTDDADSLDAWAAVLHQTLDVDNLNWTFVRVVVDDQDSPLVVSGSNLISYLEGAASPVATYSVVDAKGAVTWRLLGKDRDSFAISKAGALSFNTTPDHDNPADSDGDNVYHLTIQAAKGTSTGALLTVVITVTARP